MAESATREKVLQVARDLFTTKGFANASISDICREAGVSPPTLYYHFGSKDGLFEAVVEETLNLDEFHGLVRQAVAASSGLRAKLRAYVRTYLTQFPTQVLNPGLHLQHSTELNERGLVRLHAGIAGVYQVARDLLQEGMERGEFRQVHVDHAASCLMGTVDSFVRGQVYLGAAYNPGEVTDAIVDLFTHGLAAELGGDDRRAAAARGAE